MAFKLSKAENTRKSELEGDLNKVFGEAEEAKDVLTDKIADLIREFNEGPLTALNDKISEAQGFVEDIERERHDEYDEKSERWMESERGESASSWLSQWEMTAGELDAIPDIEVPELEIDLGDPETLLSDLPTEMDG